MTRFRSFSVTGFCALALGLCGWILLNTAPAAMERPALDLPFSAPTAHANQTLNFFDTALGGDDFVWCIDRSCSTGWDGDLATMKLEIINALEQLTPGNRFSVVAFSDTTLTWSTNLEVATPTEINSAIAFVDGLVSSGATCMFNALGVSLDIAEQSLGEASIILVADGPNFCAGTPSSGTPPDAMAVMVSAINPDAIPIHGFHVSVGGSGGVATLEAIADATGGIFVDTSNPGPSSNSTLFVRGDVNNDGTVDISDVVVGLAGLFQGQPIDCVDALDANDDGAVDVSDAVYTLQSLFSPTGIAPPAPFPSCGLDPTCDTLDCATVSAGCPELDFTLAVTEIFGLSFATDAVDGDFNADGLTDLAVCDSDSIQVYLGTGGGLLAVGANYPIAMNVGRLTAADLDQDGNLDLVYAGSLGGATSELITLLGVGDGSFTVSTAPIDYEARWIETGDVNGDGVVDVVVANEFGALIYSGNGDGTLTFVAALPGGGRTSRALLCDANGDGFLDVAALDEFQDEAELYLGDGLGGFGPGTITDLVSNDIPAMIADDFNGDGLADLLVMKPNLNDLVVLRGNGDGTFTEILSLSVPSFSWADLAAADFDGDGDLDVMMVNTDLFVVLINDGSGIFSTEVVVPAPGAGSPTFVRLLDFDDDGDLDCVTRWSNTSIQITENTLIP